MKKKYKYWLYKRGKYWWIQNAETKKQESLHTEEREEAERLRNAKEDAELQPALALALGRVYTTAADPKLAKRVWREVMDEYCISGGEATRLRKRKAMDGKDFDVLRYITVWETTGDHLRAVLKSGKVSVNHHLRSLVNLANDSGYLPRSILPKRLWPKEKYGEKRGITLEEHQRIMAYEMPYKGKNSGRARWGTDGEDWKLFWQMLWETGAAQTDGATLTAEHFDLNTKVLSYQRHKNQEWCRLGIGPSLLALLAKLPEKGKLFPRLA